MGRQVFGIGIRFCKSNGVFFSTLPARVKSMDLQCIRFQKQNSQRKSQIAIWVDGRDEQILRPNRNGRQVLHGHQEGTTKIREQLEVGSQRPGTCLTDGQKERPLGGSESHQELGRAMKLDRVHSKNVIEQNRRGTGKHGQINSPSSSSSAWTRSRSRWTSSKSKDYR